MKKYNPFPIDVYKVKCKNHDAIKQYMMKHVYPDFSKNGPNKSNSQNIYTDYLPGNTAMVHWPYVYDLYQEDVKNILEDIGFNLSDGWTINLKGWYNFTEHNSEEFFHDHIGGASQITYSFVHYVNLEDTHGTVFSNPNMKLIRGTSPTKDMRFLPNCFLNDREYIDVNEGDMLFFPSWLEHSAPAHTNNTLRAVNAVNVMLRNTNDKDGL